MKRVNQKQSDESLSAKKVRENSPEQSPEATPDRSLGINLFAYDVQQNLAKSLQKLLIMDKIVRNAVVIQERNLTGILMSFASWKKVAKFHEWAQNGERTRSLSLTIRVSCGPVEHGPTTAAHDDADKILGKRWIDEAMPDHQEGIEDIVDDAQATEERTNFIHYLQKGVYCRFCQRDHVPSRPKF